MRLYSGKVPIIAREIVRQLTSLGHIEVNNREEAELDIQSVLKEYIRRDREVTEETKDTLERRRLPHGQFGKVRRLVAEQKGHEIGEDGILWMCNQILETFMQSQHVEEIFAKDSEMRRKMAAIVGRHMRVDEELDGAVRDRLKNLQEGSEQWDVEYKKVMEQLKRRQGLS